VFEVGSAPTSERDFQSRTLPVAFPCCGTLEGRFSARFREFGVSFFAPCAIALGHEEEKAIRTASGRRIASGLSVAALVSGLVRIVLRVERL